jgi:hypothetical protein
VKSFLAELARAIGAGEGHDNEVSFLHYVNVGSDRFNYADGFVAHEAAIWGRWQILIWPEIAATDTGSGNPNQRIRGLVDCCVRHVFNTNVSGLIHNSCTHKFLTPFVNGF